MNTVHQPPDTGERPDGPLVTPYFAAALKRVAARRGLPPDPFAA